MRAVIGDNLALSSRKAEQPDFAPFVKRLRWIAGQVNFTYEDIDCDLYGLFTVPCFALSNCVIQADQSPYADLGLFFYCFESNYKES